jgi:hypothetical protein
MLRFPFYFCGEKHLPAMLLMIYALLNLIYRAPVPIQLGSRRSWPKGRPRAEHEHHAVAGGRLKDAPGLAKCRDDGAREPLGRIEV